MEASILSGTAAQGRRERKPTAMKILKRVLPIVLAVCLLASLGAVSAIDAGETRTVIGADLTDDQIKTVYLRHRARQRQGADRHESGRAAIPQRCHQRRADRHEGHLLHLHRGACRRKRHDRQHVAHYLLHEPDVHQRAGDCRHHGREDHRDRAVRRLGHCGADRHLQGV